MRVTVPTLPSSDLHSKYRFGSGVSFLCHGACWFQFERLPRATGPLNGPYCVSVLQEPPLSCPPPRPTGGPSSSQTHWPTLLPFLPLSSSALNCVSVRLQLLPNLLFLARYAETLSKWLFLFWLLIYPPCLSLF